MEWESILDAMLGVSDDKDYEVNPALKDFVSKINDRTVGSGEVCTERGCGSLRSRQTIALAVETWRLINPSERLTVPK